MNLRAVIIVASLLACFAPKCSTGGQCPADTAQAIPLCDVLVNAHQYDGREIIVQGAYSPSPEYSLLVAPLWCKATSRFVNLQLAPNYKANKSALKTERSLLKHHQEVDEVLRGMFHVAHQEQCFGPSCNLYEIEVTELLCAKPTTSDPGPH